MAEKATAAAVAVPAVAEADPLVWEVSSAAVLTLEVMLVLAVKAASVVFLEVMEGSVESSVATVVPVLEDPVTQA